MKVFGETEKKIIGKRHGEKLFVTLMTGEERLRATDMGNYFRISPDGRSLNYDKFYIEGQAAIMESVNSLHGKKTMIIIAHRLTTIENCDVVYRVADGKVVKERGVQK